MSELMRSEFEAWIAERIANNGPNHWLKRKPSEDLIDNGGPYQMIWVEAAWQGWKASRASMVVELPELVDGFLYGRAWNSAIGRCRGLIEAAGVRVKP